MSVLVVLVPMLLIVVLGYAVGYTVWEATGLGGNPEVAGWLTGLFLLAGLTRALLSWHRRRRGRG
ncbi:MAG: hypothetical protein M3Q47_15680 [Actinomycetota bacterium]|nr:hypothetical protein [Actinomycetota bacterium]